MIVSLTRKFNKAITLTDLPTTEQRLEIIKEIHTVDKSLIS